MEAIRWFINQSPGCLQGMILAPVAAWQPLPCSGAVSDLGNFGTKTRPLGCARRVTSDTTDRDAAGAGIDSGERGDTCRAEWSQFLSRKRALSEQATPVLRAGHDPGDRPCDWASDNLPLQSLPTWRRSLHSRRRLQRPQRRRAASGIGIHCGVCRLLSPSHSKA